MTSRTRTPPTRSAAAVAAADGPVPEQRIGWAESPPRLRIGFGLAVLGAALLIAGPVVGLLRDSPAPGFSSMPLLVVLALLPPLVAAGFFAVRKPVVAAGVLVGSALIAPGRLLVDTQLLVDPLLVSRPELMVPTSLAPLAPAAGLWLLLAGHVLVGAAGLLAAGRAGAESATGYAAEFDDHSDDRSARARGTSLLVALIAGTTAAVGFLLSPFTSTDAYQLARNVVDNPGLLRYGTLALAVATAVAAVFGAGSARPSVARGVLLGATLAVAAVAVPQIVAGLAVDRLGSAPGPYLAVFGLTVLTAIVWLFGRLAPPAEQAEVSLESGRVHRVAGVLGVLTGVAALVAAFGAQLVVTDGLEQPVTYSNRLFIPAGLLVLALAVALLVPRAASSVRPAFTVALAAVPLAGASTLDAAFTATGVSAAVRIGAGVWFACAALVLAIAAAVAAALAGGAERDDVDLTERRANLALSGPLAAAALFAVGAFGLPAVKAPELVPPGIWSEFRLASWGLLIAVLVVLVATAIAPVSRPPRAAALLLGAAGLVAVRLLEYPLTAGRAEGAGPGPGMWLSLACVAALVVSALVAVGSRARR
ncbi:hypothetical protein [Actinokineospora sp. NBRC 105648]|uniref:hypothetical protein n=1 Tax=Actinokineospora sp. NBRC 105648 TaxID=3032206 RepID=UPI002552A3B9|nr:hypothetical protein [Actinokineospora sp. NBRC 105648]